MPGRRRARQRNKTPNGPKPAGRSNAKAGRNGPKRRANGGMRPSGPSKRAAAAAAYSTGLASGQPRVQRDSVGQCRIVHRELISSVSGTTAFTVASTFALNPGIASTFPWLSVEAAGWERYKFNKLVFRYYTRTGTSTPGSVILSPDYDAADAPPTNEQMASSFKDAQEDAPWKDIVCTLGVSNLLGGANDKYIRLGNLPANQDIKTYDSGNLHLCTTDGSAVNWGKLWVEYDVTLKVPQLQEDQLTLSNSAVVIGAGSVSNTSVFGTAPTFDGGLSMAASGNVLTFNKVGEYLLVLAAGGTTLTYTPPTVITGSTTVASNTQFQPFLINAAGTQGTLNWLVKVTVVGQTFALDWSADDASITAMVANIVPAPYDLLHTDG